LFLLLLKFLLLNIILFGLAQFLSFKLKMRSDFIPVTIFTGIGLILFMAGLLNVMPEAVKLVSLFSVGSLVYVHWKKKSFENIFSSGMLFFLLGSVYLAVFLRGMQLEYYDDFSHWGLIVREMLATDRLPNFSSEVIMFQAYPPGTAVVLYFIGKILGDTEGVMLFGQGMLYLSCLAPLFAFVQKKKYIGWLLIVPATLYFLTGNLGIVALSVDTLLSLLAISGTAILVYYYRNKKIEEAVFPVMLIAVYLNIVKNSGILFVIILVFLYVMLMTKGSLKKAQARVGALWIMGMPVLAKFLWDKHVKLVFADTAASKHAMSVDNYKNIFGEKTTADIKQITNNLFLNSLDIEATEIKILVAAFVAVGLVWYLKKKDARENARGNSVHSDGIEKKLLIFMAATYIIYQVGLWATYVFSMPLAEASYLASYNRYNITCIMYLLGVTLLYFLIEMDRLESGQRIKQASLLGISFVLVLLPLFYAKDVVQNVFVKKDYGDTYKTNLRAVVQKYQLNNEWDYIVYVSDYTEKNSKDYLYYLSCYELQTRYVTLVDQDTVGSLGELNDPVKIIVLKDDDIIEKKLKEYGIDVDDTVIQMN